MNNEQFRKLVLANEKAASGTKNGPPPTPGGRSGSGSLGSRQRASIPMTPRSVAGAQSDFARQLAERNQAAQPKKNFKAFAPKGAKLAAGYTDRTRDRVDEAEDDRRKRLTALEQALRKGEVDQETYDRLRFEIAGGSLETTHLVKGLDFKLLERIRRGEDVRGNKKDDEANDDKPDVDRNDDDDVDNAFDELEQRQVSTIEKEKEKKVGQLAAFPVVPGQKRTRDQILAELKASREAAKAQQGSSLGSKFKKIGSKQKPGTRIERDNKGREVLIIVDEDGHEKRKVRKLKAWVEDDEAKADEVLPMPDPHAKPLGMEVPEQYKHAAEPEEDADDDIFGGIGDDYDPLAGIDASDSDSEPEQPRSEAGDEKQASSAADEPSKAGRTDAEMMPPPPKVTKPAARPDYFKDSKTGLLSAEEAPAPSLKDPAIMAAIKRAAALSHAADGGEDEDADAEEGGESTKARRARLLHNSSRDDADMDLGFGTSRLEDEEDGDEQRVKLSVWGGEGGEGGKGAHGKRKRGPKKRKGDANSAADVLRVMEQRKKS